MILGLDTSGEQTRIALFDKQICQERSWSHQNNQSKDLLPAIDRLLRNNKIKLTDLAGIFIVLGPGSYTGLRVGVSVANVLAASLNIPIFGHSVDKQDESLIKLLHRHSLKFSQFPAKLKIMLPIYE